MKKKNLSFTCKKKPEMRLLVSILLMLVFNLNFLFAQNVENRQSLRNDYELKQVVILSRHNIRAPLSSADSELGKVTDHKWNEWTAGPSELTTKGGVLETMMGQYFRKWLDAEGLLKEGYCPNVDEINIYANSMQRTIATAEYFKAGFLPTCNQDIYHRFAPSKMDPVFFPGLTKVNEDFKSQALKEINQMGGKKGIIGINESLQPSYETLKKVIGLQNSRACKEDNICDFNDYNTQLKFELGKEPDMSGSLKLATRVADALILQYLEVPDDLEASFGQSLTLKDWENISRIKDVYGDVLFSAPIVAANVANPLLKYIKDELKASQRKFTFLVGHDSNISSVTSALKFEEYTLPETIEKKTPLGCKLVFEKWQNKTNKKEYIVINLVYQTTGQLRNLTPLNLNNPPVVFQLKISGLQSNDLGLYDFEDILKRFDEAFAAYENIR